MLSYRMPYRIWRAGDLGESHWSDEAWRCSKTEGEINSLYQECYRKFVDQVMDELTETSPTKTIRIDLQWYDGKVREHRIELIDRLRKVTDVQRISHRITDNRDPYLSRLSPKVRPEIWEITFHYLESK